MLLEQALYNYLSTYAGLIALTSTRVYPVVLPQGATLPAVTFMRVSTERIRTFGAPRLGAVARVQLTIWAATVTSRQAVGTQLRNALEGYSGTMGGGGGVVVAAVQQANELDDYEPAGSVYQGALDFLITYDGD